MKQAKNLLVIMVAGFFLLALQKPVDILAKQYYEPGDAAVSGDWLYHNYSAGITRVNLKTGEKQLIIRDQNYGYDQYYPSKFGEITVKGKMIYATWDKFIGTADSCYYIYQISMNGEAKKLACGCKGILAGNRIYFNRCKAISAIEGEYTKEIGKASMSLDGTNQKKEKSTAIQIKPCKTYDYDYFPLKIKGITYSIEGKNVMRKRGKVKKVLFRSAKDYEISSLEIRSGIAIITAKLKNSDRMKTYAVKENGQKLLLASWRRM